MCTKEFKRSTLQKWMFLWQKNSWKYTICLLNFSFFFVQEKERKKKIKSWDWPSKSSDLNLTSGMPCCSLPLIKFIDGLKESVTTVVMESNWLHGHICYVVITSTPKLQEEEKDALRVCNYHCWWWNDLVKTEEKAEFVIHPVWETFTLDVWFPKNYDTPEL